MAGILNKLLTEAEPTKEETYQGAPQDTVDAVQEVISKNPAMAGIIKSISNKKPTSNPDIMLGLGGLVGGGSILGALLGDDNGERRA